MKILYYCKICCFLWMGSFSRLDTVPELSNGAVWRFFELIPFVDCHFYISILVLEKKRIKLHIYSSLKNIIIGIITGII